MRYKQIYLEVKSTTWVQHANQHFLCVRYNFFFVCADTNAFVNVNTLVYFESAALAHQAIFLNYFFLIRFITLFSFVFTKQSPKLYSCGISRVVKPYLFKKKEHFSKSIYRRVSDFVYYLHCRFAVSVSICLR